MSFRGLVELELQSCDLRIGYIPSGPFGVSHSGRLGGLGLGSSELIAQRLNLTLRGLAIKVGPLKKLLHICGTGLGCAARRLRWQSRHEQRRGQFARPCSRVLAAQ